MVAEPLLREMNGVPTRTTVAKANLHTRYQLSVTVLPVSDGEVFNDVISLASIW